MWWMGSVMEELSGILKAVDGVNQRRWWRGGVRWRDGAGRKRKGELVRLDRIEKDEDGGKRSVEAEVERLIRRGNGFKA